MRLSPRRRRLGASRARSVWPPLPAAAQQDPQTDPVETRFLSFFNKKKPERKSNTVTERSARRGLADLPRAPCAPQASSGPREAGSSAALGARQRLLPDSPGPRGPASARPRAPTAHEGQSTGLCPRPGPGLRQPSGLRGQLVLQLLQARHQLGQWAVKEVVGVRGGPFPFPPARAPAQRIWLCVRLSSAPSVRPWNSTRLSHSQGLRSSVPALMPSSGTGHRQAEE